MVSQEIQQRECFVSQEIVQLHRIGIDCAPHGQFGVQVDAFLIGCGKGSLGRGVGVEAVVVDAILLGYGKEPAPCLHIGRTIGSEREHTGIVCAP